MQSDLTHSHEDLREALTRVSATRFVLPNGLTVIHQADYAARLASVQVWFKTGSIHEDAWLGAGLSHFLEHMLFKGTARRGPLDISREVHALGAYINAYTTYDRTVYYIDAPSEAAAGACDILADMCFSASLADDGFQTEREVILREIAMGEDDPDRQLFQNFAQTAYHTHPYRHPVIGWRALFEQVTPEALRSYYRQRYVPNNAVLIITGALSEAEARELADKHFSPVPRNLCPPVSIIAEPTQLAPRSHTAYGNFQILRGMMGYRIPALGHPDLPALEVLAHLLGHGQSSRLWQSLRQELRLVHHIDASCWTPGAEGLLWISYVCDHGKRPQVEQAIARIVDECTRETFPREAVSKAVRQTLVSEINSRKSMSGQASRLGAAEVVLGDLAYPRRHLDLLEKIQPADLNRMAATYLVPERLTSVSLEATPSATGSTGSIANPHQGEPEGFTEEALPNGARLLLQPGGSLPKVHLRFACLGGPLYEPADQRGVTGVMATLLARDTASRAAREVAEAIEQIGGSFSEFVDNNTFGLSLEVLPGDLLTALDLLEQALLHTRTDPDTFAIERDGQIASIREEEDEILDYARRRLRQHFYGTHPAAIDYMGRIEDLEKLEPSHIDAARAHQLTGPRSVLAVSGQFDPTGLAPRLRHILSALHQPAGQPLPPADTFTPPAANTLFEKREREQSVVLRAYPDVGVTDPDFILSEVLDELFSGMSSVLFNRVREERGLAYYVAATRMPSLQHGIFTFYAGTRPDATAEVEHEILSEIARITAGHYQPGELEACLRRLSVHKRQSLQSPGSRAMQAALNALYGLPVNAWQTYDERLQQVTPERLTAHARRLFNPAHAIALTTGPTPA